MPQLACMADSLAHVQRRPCITAFRRSIGVGLVIILANWKKKNSPNVVNVANLKGNTKQRSAHFAAKEKVQCIA